jgi:hypothetical protein
MTITIAANTSPNTGITFDNLQMLPLWKFDEMFNSVSVVGNSITITGDMVIDGIRGISSPELSRTVNSNVAYNTVNVIYSTTTWTAPPNVGNVFVVVVGGGEGGHSTTPDQAGDQPTVPGVAIPGVTAAAAAGYRTVSSGTSYTVTVGAGGNAGSGNPNGSPSSFDNVIGGGGGTAVPASNGSVLNSSVLSAANWHTTIIANHILPSVYKNSLITNEIVSASFVKNRDNTKLWQTVGRAPGVGGDGSPGTLFSAGDQFPGVNGVVILVY